MVSPIDKNVTKTMEKNFLAQVSCDLFCIYSTNKDRTTMTFVIVPQFDIKILVLGPTLLPALLSSCSTNGLNLSQSPGDSCCLPSVLAQDS